LRTYEYPFFVDKENIDIEDDMIKGTTYRWRSFLIIPFKNKKQKKKKVITFLMKNPSLANKEWTDKTIYNVLKYVKRLGEIDEMFADITEVRILNLYPIYSTDSAELFNIIGAINDYDNIQKINDEAIKKYLRDSDYIVPSWGRKPKNVKGRNNPYQERALEIIRLLTYFPSSQLFLIKLDQKRTLFPIHPERIGFLGEKINKFLLNPYKITGNRFVPK
jgi:hypothetical protein